MRTWALAGVLSLAGGAALAGERVETEHGWYRTEDGFGEASAGAVVVIVAESAGEEPAESSAVLPQAGQEPVGPSERSECDEVRGRYLARVLELRGLDLFGLDPGLLAAWTLRRATFVPGAYGWSAAFDEPALALLYGLPPVPPGALGHDFTLQNLAREVLACDARQVPSPTTPPEVEQGGFPAR